MFFSLISLGLLAGLASAGWLGNGQAEWSARCAAGAEMAGDFVCFTSPNDITQQGATGAWSGYAASDGRAFALIKSSDSGELMTLSQHRISIQWLGESKAHCSVQDLVNGNWVTNLDSDTVNPDGKYIFQLSATGAKQARKTKPSRGRKPPTDA